MGQYKYKDVLGLVDKKAEGKYMPWWMYESSKKCLYQYRIIRDKPKGVVAKRKVSAPLLLGSGIHIGMQKWTEGRSSKVCRECICKELVDVADGQVSKKQLKLIIEEAIHYFCVAQNLVKPLMMKRGVAEAPCRQYYEGYVYGCRIDHIEIADEEKKIVEIWDYKGSASEGSVKSAQLRFYTAVVELAGWTVRKAWFVLPLLDMVKPIRMPKFKNKILDDIKSHIESVECEGLYDPKPSLWNCKFCNWGLDCPHSILSLDLSDLREGKVVI